MMRGKTLKPIRVAALGLVVLVSALTGVAEGAGAQDRARPASQVVAWNSTSASCVTCTPIG